MSTEEKKKINPYLIVVTVFILSIPIIAALLKWGVDVIVVTGITIVAVVVLYIVYRIWEFFSHGNMDWRIALLAAVSITLMLTTIAGINKLFDYVSQDKTPASPTILGLVVIGGSIFSMRLLSGEFNHRTTALYMLVYTAIYAYFHREMWFYSIAIAAIASWWWLKILIKYKYSNIIKIRSKNLPTIKETALQALRAVALSLIPFVGPVMLVSFSSDWWQTGTIILSYSATIYLCWSTWIDNYI